MDPAGEGGIFPGHGRSDPKNIAHLQAFDRQGSGQEAGQLALLKRLLAAKHREPLPLGNQINCLIAPDDDKVVDDEVALVRNPWKRDDVVLGQALRRIELGGEIDIRPLHSVFEPHLQFSKRTRIAHIRQNCVGQLRRHHPRGRWLIQRLV